MRGFVALFLIIAVLAMWTVMWEIRRPCRTGDEIAIGHSLVLGRC